MAQKGECGLTAAVENPEILLEINMDFLILGVK